MKSIFCLLGTLVSLSAFASDLPLGKSAKFSLAPIPDFEGVYSARPFVNEGQVQVLVANFGILKALDLNGQVLKQTSIPKCVTTKLSVNELASTALAICEEYPDAFAIIDLKTFTAKIIPLPFHYKSADGTEYETESGLRPIIPSKLAGDDFLVIQSRWKAKSDFRQQLTQFRTFSTADGSMIGSIDLPGYKLDKKERFFKVGTDLHMVSGSIYFKYRTSKQESSGFGDTLVIETVNLSKGQIVKKIEIPYSSYGDVRCVDGDLAQINGQLFMVAKYNATSTALGCAKTLPITWTWGLKDVYQYALVNVMTLQPDAPVHSKILKGWEDRPFAFSSIRKIESVTNFNGRASLRSSDDDMTFVKNQSVYIDLATGRQFVGPFGQTTFKLAEDEVSVGYSTDRSEQKIHTNLMNQSGTQSVEMSVTRACVWGHCELNSDVLLNRYGGLVASKDQLFFISIEHKPNPSVEISRLH